MIFLDQAASADTEDSLVPIARLDNDWRVIYAAFGYFANRRALLGAAFFIKFFKLGSNSDSLGASSCAKKAQRLVGSL